MNNCKEFLLVGIHNSKKLNLVGIDLATCEVVVKMPVPYDDVEGISFEATTCPGIEKPVLPDNIKPLALIPPLPPKSYLPK